MKKKFILFISLFILIIVITKNINKPLTCTSSYNNIKNETYSTIKKDFNENYDGIGQKEVSGKDGFFTTFTTCI